MSVVDLHDWHFREDGDLEEGIAAIREYVQYLKDEEPGMQLSLWLRDQEDPLRYFHVAVYQDHVALERARRSAGTARFVDRLYPEIDEETHTAPECDVILSSWAGIQPQEGS